MINKCILGICTLSKVLYRSVQAKNGIKYFPKFLPRFRRTLGGPRTRFHNKAYQKLKLMISHRILVVLKNAVQ